ncbi:LmeA family phospholipid-binding protein [Aestuariimicrobium sp. Y1814]|uniref:LmeA family phospholipid-binding protein n=1 Tax=Aestuariimicrobium sp. Y1814 TaxID=3418742 RepID=UPI003DA7819E
MTGSPEPWQDDRPTTRPEQRAERIANSGTEPTLEVPASGAAWEPNPFTEPGPTLKLREGEAPTRPFDFDDLPDEPTLVEQEAEEPAYEPTLTDLHRDDVLAGRTAARPGPRRKPRPWGWIILSGLLVLLLVLGLAAVIGENYARRTANNQISQALSDALKTTATATVEDRIVLWSLARGGLRHVEVDAPESTITTEDFEFTLQSVKGTAYDITNTSDPANAQIGNLDATVVMAWSELSRLSGVDVRPATDGRVQVDRTISVLGADIGVQITALPRIDPSSGRIILEDPQARAARVPIPTVLLQAALDRVNERLVLPALPSITYQEMTVTQAGLSLTLKGTDVKVSDFG